MNEEENIMRGVVKKPIITAIQYNYNELISLFISQKKAYYATS